MTEMTNIDKAELCEQIADILEERGHCVGSYMEPDGSVCLLGAGRLAQGVVNVYEPGLLSVSVDTRTSKALDHDKVPWLNDGVRLTLDGKREVTGEALNKETAIEYAMKMAKRWRELG